MRYLAKENTPLLSVLEHLFPDSSKRTFRLWLEGGRISIDGTRIDRINKEVQAGQTVTIGPKGRFLQEGIQILYQDESIVVIEKPTGVLSVATDLNKEESAHSYLKKFYHPGRVYPVHRLDRETSGVMVFALTEESKISLKKQFEKREVGKVYLALVEGSFAEKQGVWQSYLQEDERYFVHASSDEEKGKIAITQYELIKKTKRFSLLQLSPQTGRKHQLRVHCQKAGHPILGDKRYGSNLPAARLFLHAHRLSFRHPVSGKSLSFLSPLPHTFQQ